MATLSSDFDAEVVHFLLVDAEYTVADHDATGTEECIEGSR